MADEVEVGVDEWQEAVALVLVQTYADSVDALLQRMMRSLDCESEERMRIGHLNLMNTAAIAAIHASVSCASASCKERDLDAAEECGREIAAVLQKYYPHIPTVMPSVEAAAASAAAKEVPIG